MKPTIFMPLLAFMALLTFSSCSTEDFPVDSIDALALQNAPAPKEIEIEILELINVHRIEAGLSPLNSMNIVKSVALTHTDYMVEKNSVNHDNFYQRKISLEQNANATRVGENVAYAYSTAQSLVNAWINSDSHRENIEGDYTDFEVSAEQNKEGKWYYTNIFIKR
jgi:uncharacterized protein YkwD